VIDSKFYEVARDADRACAMLGTHMLRTGAVLADRMARKG
jgi:hypothetical protein